MLILATFVGIIAGVALTLWVVQKPLEVAFDALDSEGPRAYVSRFRSYGKGRWC